MGSEIAATRPFSDQGYEIWNTKGTCDWRHPATGEEAAIVGDVVENGKGG